MTTTIINLPIDSENRQITFRKVGEVWQGVERDTLSPNLFTLIDVDSDLAADLERIAAKL